MFNGLKVKIMKKKVLFAAMAIVALASCSSDEMVSLSSPPESNSMDPETSGAIVFSSASKGITRADFTGKDAAELLNNQFVVAGYKGTSTTWADLSSSIVFDNYAVQYTANTANTTESNSKNWEYVGITPIAHATTNGISSQTIKYWDYSKAQYDFMAWGIGKKLEGSTPTAITPIYTGTPEAGQVFVSAITYKTATGDDGIAYTFTGEAADLAHCYVSDLVTVKKTGTAGTGTVIGYGNPVTLRFRQFGTKVRIALYETVPGYSVKRVKFYTKGDVLDVEPGTSTTPGTIASGQIVDNATIFAAGADIYTHGTYTVYFPTVNNPSDADNNQAHIKYTGNGSDAKTTIVDWGTLNYTYREKGEKDDGAVYLGRASNKATFAGEPADNYYKFYLPNETGTNLNLRVDFTLESIDGSGETIEVKNAKAQVPSIYTAWKPGYAYTYLFKISDNTNGRTGVYDPTQADDATINSDPVGLYPITFDAMVVDAEDGNHEQETITTIATPSITSYQKGSKVIDNDEYLAATGDIFVTVNENDDVVALRDGAPATDKAALYTIPSGKTEADVVDALTYRNDDQTGGSIMGRSGLVLTEVEKVASDVTLTANQWKLTDKVEYGVDGNVITVATDKVLRFKPNAGYYAFVYTETAPTTTTDYFEARAFDNFESGETKYRYAYKPTVATGNNGTPDDPDDDFFDAQKGHVYYSESGGDYSKVTSPFIGQGVSNLYLNNTGTSKASGYAVSGTRYYYTTNGQTFPEAHLVEWSSAEGWFTGLGLYERTDDLTHYPTGYKETTDAAPVDGKAYYYNDSENYIYCVFLPMQVKGMYELDTVADKVEAHETTAVEGQTYFERYLKNNGVYYAKIIKVQ